MSICLVVAAAQNNAIGIDNAMPWHLPNDLQYFKKVTMAKPIIMGRKTFDSIGRPLPGRDNIVISRQSQWQHEGVQLAASLDEAIDIAKGCLSAEADHEIMIIGGAEIYKQALPFAQKIYLTRVNAEVKGDAFFPALDSSAWREISCEKHAACERNPYDYEFCVLERVTSGDKFGSD